MRFPIIPIVLTQVAVTTQTALLSKNGVNTILAKDGTTRLTGKT